MASVPTRIAFLLVQFQVRRYAQRPPLLRPPQRVIVRLPQLLRHLHHALVVARGLGFQAQADSIGTS